MGDVVILGGATRLDIPPERVLSGALGAGMSKVVVVGYDKDGNEYLASSVADGAEIVWLLERAKYKLIKD